MEQEEGEPFLLLLTPSLQNTLIRGLLVHKAHTTRRKGMSIACSCNQTQQAHTVDEHIKASVATGIRIPCISFLVLEAMVVIGSSKPPFQVLLSLVLVADFP